MHRYYISFLHRLYFDNANLLSTTPITRHG
jgi:hypothetical protein